MSVFVLKIIALAAMIIDHTGFFLGTNAFIGGPVYELMRSVGRIAFPVYAFLLVNGFQKTSNRQRYLSRLLLFALLSQIPFTLSFSLLNYGYDTPEYFSLSFNYELLPYLVFTLIAVIAYILLVKADISALYAALFLLIGGVRLQLFNVQFLGGTLNIFYTLSFALAAMAVLDDLGDRDKSLVKTVVLGILLAVATVLLVPNSDYGYMGLVLMLGLYVFRRWRAAQLAVIGLWCFFEYWGSGPQLMFWFSLISLLPVLLYNGKKGPAMKLAFYAVYPLHLLVLGVINIFI
ncbi:MAG: TraX family protein [Oscillospiraceae bacterium]